MGSNDRQTSADSGGRRGHNPFASLRSQLGTPETPRAVPAKAELKSVSSDRVTVRRERTGRGGKTVTIAEGPGLAGRDVAVLARDSARALGVGARVERGALVVQGDQAERLVEWLSDRGFTSVARGN